MIKVFLSYSHEDEALRAELHKHLGVLRREKIIETWSDHQVPVGSNWNNEILGQLEEANLILLLISSSFLDSHYCDDEMKRAIERHGRREAIVVPILVGSCYWQVSPFAAIQGLPKDMNPVGNHTSKEKRDQVWSEVAKGVHEAAIACNHLSGSRAAKRETRSEGYPRITVRGILAVDEDELRNVIDMFKKGDEVGIQWPNSSNQLILLMREAIGRFDEANVNVSGADDFIQRAPVELARTLQYRNEFEQRLPKLMSIMSDYEIEREAFVFGIFQDTHKQRWASAIKYYLLWANFVSHRQLGKLSSWAGKRLGLKVPEAWIPYQMITDTQWLKKLYPQRGNTLLSVIVGEIGGRDLGYNRASIYVPPEHVKGSRFRSNASWMICEFAIPQYEVVEKLIGATPLNSYSGYWEGSYIPSV